MPENVLTAAQMHSYHTRYLSNAQNSPSQASTVCELPDVQVGFRKGRGTRDQIANIHWIIKKEREFQKNNFSALLTMTKPLTVWITINWKILKEMGIPDHLTCLLRNLYAGQEATVRTGHGTTNWFQIGKGVHQGYILSPCLFNLNAEYIMRNAGMDEAQAGNEIAGRNINNLRYADDTTLMAESEEKLKYILMKVKEKQMFFWNLLPSSTIQQMLAV